MRRTSRRSDVAWKPATRYRSALAADALQQMGYTNVASMDGGFRGWTETGGPVEGGLDND